MIIVRAYQALGEAVVEVTARVCHDYAGAAIEPRSLFIGRAYYDATGSVNPDDVSLWLGMALQQAEEFVGSDLGGWHQLL